MTDPAPWNNPLVRSAQKWLAEALSGWAEADSAKVITLAPVAAEHLGKAALWHRNPVLLAPLDRAHQRSFLMLATAPDLNDATLRTVGLADVLSRLPTVFAAALPLDDKRKRRLIECRGGAVHVGQFTPENAQHVLTDVLTLVRWLSDLMSMSHGVLFGVHSDTANRLLDERRSAKERDVDRRLASAQSQMTQLARSVGEDLLHDTIAQKEALTLDHLPRLISVVSVSAKQRCPACHQQGMLLGDLETDVDVDAEWNPDGTVYSVGYDYLLIPDSFYCHVCGLTLVDTEELEYCQLPSQRFSLPDEEITDELVQFAQDQEAWVRETTDRDD